MSSYTTHPLADAWLRDLELLLHGVEPGERAEVLAGVREHLDGSLPAGATDDDVRRVLTEMGSPQSVADEAYADRPAPAPAWRGSPPGPTQPPALARSWVPITVGILLGVCLLWMTLTIGSGFSYTTSSTSSGTQVSPAGEEVAPVETLVSYDGNPMSGIVLGLATSPLLWIPAVVLVLLSRLWTTRQKVALCLVAPVGAVLISASPALGWALTHQEIGINIGAWVGLAAALGGGGWLLLHLCRSALAQSRREVAP